MVDVLSLNPLTIVYFLTRKKLEVIFRFPIFAMVIKEIHFFDAIFQRFSVIILYLKGLNL